jgi:cell wall-associated NlpC family hydrolase
MRAFCLIVLIALVAGCASRGAIVDVPPPASGTTPAAANEVALFALAQLGVPYAFGGATPDRGFDCSGLVTYVFRRVGNVELPRTTFELARMGSPVSDEGLQPGDLLFFNTLRKDFSHVGIYLGDARFIHAPATGGAVRIEDLRIDYWTRRYNGARRVSI